MAKQFFVYILTNKRYGTLYTGVSSDLIGRTYRHKEKILGGFTARYGVGYLVYYEAHATAEAAITREKQIKKWKREWKINLIEGFNPAWKAERRNYQIKPVIPKALIYETRHSRESGNPVPLL